MQKHELETIAAALYDGGWRAADREELIAEHDLTDNEADAICQQLEQYEAKHVKE